MDFYNPLFWVINDGFYETYNSVYPAINYYILKIFALFVDAEILDSGFELRFKYPFVVLFAISSYLLILFVILNIGKWREFNFTNRLEIFFSFSLSVPVLFAIERANLIFYALLFFALYINAKDRWLKAIFLAILINIKPYFILLLLQHLNMWDKDYGQLIRTIFVAAIIFFILGFLAQIDFIKYISTLILFNNGKSLSAEGVISLAHSVAAINYLKAFVPYDGVSHYTFWWSLLKVFNGIAMIGLTYVLLTRPLTRFQILLGCFVLLTNFSIGTGGYVFLIYIILLPYLLKDSDLKFYALPILIIFFLPVDWISILNINFQDRLLYSTGESVYNLNLSIGLGSILRPLLNFSLVILFVLQFHKIKSIKIDSY